MVISLKTNKIVKMAVLCALSIIFMLLIRFPIIPSAPFLEYEPADVPILIGAFLYGPLSGLLITVIVSIIQTITVSAASGWIGLVMHVMSTGVFVAVAGLIYKKFHTLFGSIIAAISGCICMTLIAIPLNLILTVKFLGVPYDVVKGMIPTAIIPFNIIKSVVNSIIGLCVYKAIINVSVTNNESKKI